MSNPFESPSFAIPTSNEASQPPTQEVETQVVENQVAVDSNEAETKSEEVNEDGTEKKTRKRAKRDPNKPIRRKTPEEIKYILVNYAKMDVADIATKLGIDKTGVYSVVNNARNSWLKRAEASEPEKAEKIKEWVETNLPKKERGFRAGEKRGSILDDCFEEFFSDLM